MVKAASAPIGDTQSSRLDHGESPVLITMPDETPQPEKNPFRYVPGHPSHTHPEAPEGLDWWRRKGGCGKSPCGLLSKRGLFVSLSRWDARDADEDRLGGDPGTGGGKDMKLVAALIWIALAIFLLCWALGLEGCADQPQQPQSYYPTSGVSDPAAQMALIQMENDNWTAEREREQQIRDRYQQAPIFIYGTRQW